MESFNKLQFQQKGFKELKKLDDLDINQPFKIIKAARCQTRFGSKIRMELQDFDIFLPIKNNLMEDKELEELSFFFQLVKKQNKEFYTFEIQKI